MGLDTRGFVVPNSVAEGDNKDLTPKGDAAADKDLGNEPRVVFEMDATDFI